METERERENERGKYLAAERKMERAMKNDYERQRGSEMNGERG